MKTKTSTNKRKIVVTEITESLDTLAARYKELQAQTRAIKTEMDLLKDKIVGQVPVGTADEPSPVILSNGTKITYTYSVRVSLDTTLLKKERPDIYEEFSKESDVRTLIVS
jgi:predicted phage-related endonuclease